MFFVSRAKQIKIRQDQRHQRGIPFHESRPLNFKTRVEPYVYRKPGDLPLNTALSSLVVHATDI